MSATHGNPPEPTRKISLTYNPPEFTHQATTKLRLRQALMQKCPQSNTEFRNQPTVPATKAGESPSKPTTPTALLEKFGS